MSSPETTGQQVDGLAAVRQTIYVDARAELDDFAAAEYTYFDVCRAYNAEISGDNHWNLEQATISLEIKARDVIQAIAASQKYSLDKLRVVHGFVVAEDILRVGFLLTLAPEADLVTMRDEGPEDIPVSMFKSALKTMPVTALISSLAEAKARAINEENNIFVQAVSN